MVSFLSMMHPTHLRKSQIATVFILIKMSSFLYAEGATYLLFSSHGNDVII